MHMETTQSKPIIKEVILNAPIARVWKAITDKDQMREWYMNIANFEPVMGYEFTFNGECDGDDSATSCKVIAVEEHKKLAYTWSYDKYPAETIVTFELMPMGDKTYLKLTHEGLKKIPNTSAEYSRDGHDEGWAEFIQHALKNFVEQ